MGMEGRNGWRERRIGLVLIGRKRRRGLDMIGRKRRDLVLIGRNCLSREG